MRDMGRVERWFGAGGGGGGGNKVRNLNESWLVGQQVL